MALYWSGARVKVRYEDEFREDERDCPEDTIVIVMKPGQADDPSFVRAVRHVVALRTLENEMDRGEGRARDEKAGGREGHRGRAPRGPGRLRGGAALRRGVHGRGGARHGRGALWARRQR